MRVRVLLATVALPLVLWAPLPVVSSGATASAARLSTLERKIAKARHRIGRKKGAERTLTTEIAGYSRRIGSLQGRIRTLAARQRRIEADLDAKRAELERVRSQLRAQRARLLR
ncbi:MAG: hypothetical protein M3296_09085, partial [Actinomycetota bacterium]|nr:hypothetical protein [Actinomycetota bacterium]